MKHYNYFIKCLFSLVIVFSFCNASAQYSLRGKPYSLLLDSLRETQSISGRLATPSSSSYKLKPIDNNEEKKRATEAKKDCETCRSSYFGTVVKTPIDIKEVARMSELENGRLYKLEIESSGAYGMSFHFSKYNLPTKSSLYIYTADGKAILGAFTHINNHPDKQFSTIPLAGDKFVIEYYEANDQSGELILDRVVHAFEDIGFSGSERSSDDHGSPTNACYKDVNCSIGDNYQKHKKAVNRILYQDSDNNFCGHCTGFLIKSADEVYNPTYVLSAGHCFSSGFTELSIGERISDLVFEFDYETSSCDFGGGFAGITRVSASGAVPRAGSHPIMLSGNPGMDYLLLDLQISNIESLYPGRVAKLGWSKNHHNASVSIGHPEALEKKIATAASTEVVTQDFVDNSTPFTVRGNEYKVTWNEGHLWQGASGAPLLSNPGNYAIGLLKSGNSECDFGIDLFQSINDMWDNYDEDVPRDNPFIAGLGRYLDPYNEVTSGTYEGYFPSDDDGGGNGGGPGNGGSTCERISILHLAESIGPPALIIDDFNSLSGSLPCRDGLSPSYTEWHMTHRSGSYLDYTCNSLRTSNNLSVSGVFSDGAFKRYDFVANEEIVLSFDVDLAKDNSKVRIYATNSLAGAPSECIKGGPSPWHRNVNPTSGQLLAEIDKEYFDIQTQGQPSSTRGTYKFAVKVTPNDNYQYIWIIMEAEGYNGGVAIDNLLIYDPKKINTSSLDHDIAFETVPYLDFSGTIPIPNVDLVFAAMEKITWSGTIKNAQVQFSSREVCFTDGFHAQSGSNVIARSVSLISNNVSRPDGPLIDQIHTSNAGRVAESEFSYAPDFSNESNIFSFGSLAEEIVWSDSNPEGIGDIEVYPNSASDLVYVQANSAISEVKLLSLSGATLRSRNPLKGVTNTSIKVDGLLDGLYLIQCHLRDGSIKTKKIIIEN